MSSGDEYDAFYPPFDASALAEIEDLAPTLSLPRPTASLPHLLVPADDIDPNPYQQRLNLSTEPEHEVRPSPSPPSPDEFDAYFSGFTTADYAEIDATAIAIAAAAFSPPLPPSPRTPAVPASPPPSQLEAPTSTPTASATGAAPALSPRTEGDSDSGRRGGGGGASRPESGGGEGGGGRGAGSANGGPRIDIAVEPVPHANLTPRVSGAKGDDSATASASATPVSTSTSVSTPAANGKGKGKGKGKGRLQGKKRPKRSPYDQFRRYKGQLSVTDLTAPSWCEVQFDYGLRQKRHLQLDKRPASFVSAEGKTIQVSAGVAQVNDRITTRGRDVHKALELEVAPEAVRIEVKTNEERWALRIINMITCLQTLLEKGICREMPVFGIVHGQVVTGVIDEIIRKPMPTAPSESSPSKRPASRTSTPSPSRRRSKKSRQHSAGQKEITAFFSPTPSPKKKRYSDAAMQTEDVRPRTPIPQQSAIPEPDPEPTPPTAPSGPPPPRYALYISDTKTRTKPSLPPDEDTVASRLQLMLYHRLLSALLAFEHSDLPKQTQGRQPQPLDFNALWAQTGMKSTQQLPDAFLEQTGLAPPTPTSPGASSDANVPSNASITGTGMTPMPPLTGLSCLDDLTWAWQQAVEALELGAPAVDPTLTLVYRAQRSRRRRASKRKGRSASASASASAGEGADGFARAGFTSVEEALGSALEARRGGWVEAASPFGAPLEGEGWGWAEEDPELAWAIEESLRAMPQLPLVEGVLAAEGPAVVGEGVGEPMGEEGLIAEADSAMLPMEVDVDVDVDATPKPAGPSPSTLAGPSEVREMPAPADEQHSADESESTDEGAPDIVGTKTFKLDDAFLDERLARVLAWWRGEREPEGVEVELTRRCVTCEYREGCEWREKKAQEAMERYEARSLSQGSFRIPEEEEPEQVMAS